MYDGTLTENVTGNVKVFVICKIGAFFNFHIESIVKWGKIDLKFENKSMLRFFS